MALLTERAFEQITIKGINEKELQGLSVVNFVGGLMAKKVALNPKPQVVDKED